MKHFLPFVVCLLVFRFALAQEVLENNPPSVKWYKVSTPNFKVLYPQGFDSQALRVANTLEHIRDAESKSMMTRTRKTSIILQNQSSVSNGFVSIVPRRSEFYTMPPQDYNFGGTNDWLDQLATHEYRHIAQFDRANTGFNRALYYAFGPATLSAMAIVAVPKWFWEGDAVATETAFTHSGRGRIPNFGLTFRTNLQEGRTFNYHKQYLGSYKNEISDPYVLGYHMISYLRKRTGDPDIWGKVGKRAWSVPFIPFTFSNAIKKESGLHVTQLYREMAADLQKTWSEEQRTLKSNSFETLTARNTKTYTDYRYPQVLYDASVLAVKNGIGNIAEYVLLKDGKESSLFYPGLVNDAGMLSAAGTRIVWNEYGFDPRWRVKTYSVIKAYDVIAKKVWTVTKKSRYSGAAISPDGTSIVTVESDNAYTVSVVVINIVNGEVKKRFNNPDNAFYSMVRFSEDGKKLVALKTKNNLRSVVAMDYETGNETVLIQPSDENIGHPVLYGDYLFYNSPVNDIDNIYVFNIGQQRRLRVTSSKYGAYNPAISKDGKTIYYNEQTRNGLDVVSIPFDPSSWKEFEVRENEAAFYNVLSEQEGRPHLFDSVPQNKFETSKYSKLSGLFNPYSWGAYFNSTFTQADIGISSQDILSTTSFKAGYLFDINERTGSWRVGFSYQGLYPIIDAQVLFGKRKDDFTAFGNDVEFKWDETTFESGLRIPLLLTKSKFHQQLEFGNAVGLTKTSSFTNEVYSGDSLLYKGSSRSVPWFNVPVRRGNEIDTVDVEYVFNDQLNNGNLIYNRFYFSYYNLLKRSRRDFLSRWGQALEIDYYNTPYGGDFSGSLFAMRSSLYFPGFFKHHFLYGRFDYQKSYQAAEQDVYTFRNAISKPRGYSYPSDGTFFTFSANYALPIWYPDIALGPILNIQRIKLNLFYDYGSGKGNQYFYGINEDVGDLLVGTTDAIYKSIGAETTFDINIMRFLPKFEIGFRVTSVTANQYSQGGTLIEFLIGNIGF